MSPRRTAKAADAAAIRFPNFPPGRRTKKGLSWWAVAWIEAMEDAALESNRLARGRTYANTGRVGPITVGPGLVSAPVHGHRARPYATTLRLQTLTDRQWELFLDAAASSAGRLAALLDGEMPTDLVEAAADVGVPLLPGPGDLDPECSCPDWGHPCKHAAALCYQAGWLLDVRPMVLLLMRGRDEDRLRAELTARNAELASRGSEPGPDADPGRAPAAGVLAKDAFRAQVNALPADPRPVGSAPSPAPLDLPPAPGVDPGLLGLLVADAAVRARELLAGADRARDDGARGDGAPGDVAPPLTEREEAVRFAAALVGTPWFARYQQAAGLPDLHRAVAAWAAGGRHGLATLDEPWTPPAAVLARARSSLELAWGDDPLPEPTTWRNRATFTYRSRRVQLRLGRDGRWYPYVDVAGEWWPEGVPDADPVPVLATLLAGAAQASGRRGQPSEDRMSP